MNKISNIILIFLILSVLRYHHYNEFPAYGKKIQQTKINNHKLRIDTTYDYSIRIIKKWETYSATRYHLFGDEYIGYGHLLYKRDTVKYLSKFQADSLLRSDFNKSILFVERLCRDLECKVSINRKHVLAMFTFNCGSGTLQRSSLIKMVKRNAPDSVIKSQYYKYVYTGKRYLPKMILRRIDEFKIW